MILSFNYNGCRIQLFKIFSDTLDSVVQMHSHAKNGYEIHYIARGKGVLETEKDRYDIKKDSLYVTGSNVLHKQLSSKDAPVFEISVYLKILGNTDDAAIRFFASKFFWIGKCSPQLRRIFNQLVSENSKTGLWRESILSALTLQMITVRQKELSKIITVHLSESCAMNQRWLWQHRSLKAKTLL